MLVFVAIEHYIYVQKYYYEITVLQLLALSVRGHLQIADREKQTALFVYIGDADES